MGHNPRWWRRLIALGATGLALGATALTLSGGLIACSSTSRSASSGTAPVVDPAKPAMPDQPGAGAPGGKAAGNAAGNAPAGKANEVTNIAGQRSIIFTGSITVQVPNVDAAASSVATMAASAAGFVGTDQRQIDADRSTATITLRVPAERFAGIVDAISHLPSGIEKSRQISTQDVTGQVIDLAARIQAQQASVDRVRALMARAQSITDVTGVESELAKREADLESMQAQQRRLTDLTSLSTITAQLLGPAAAAPVKKAATGFPAGLSGGWHAFLAALRVLLTILGAVLPFAITFGGPALRVLWLLRRRTRPRPSP
jgi:hypothetical protein